MTATAQQHLVRPRSQYRVNVARPTMLTICVCSFINIPVAAADEPKKPVEEVIVTAQRRAENLQDVPITISVLSGQELDRSTFSGATDALRSIPGIDTSTDQYSGGIALSARGVSNGYDVRAAGSGTVAYYIDGVPYGFVRSAFYPDPAIYDLHQMEFLSGPQGTLYGANALNGVLRILTEDANADRFEFKARTSLSTTESGGENSRGDFAVNIPIIDGRLGVRAAAGIQDDSGWIDSRQSAFTAAREGVRPDQRDINDSERRNYRVKLHAQLDDSLSINLLAWRMETESGAPSWSNDEGRITTAYAQPDESTFDIFSAEIDKTFSAFSISSMTSYIDYAQNGVVSGTPVGFNATLTQDYDARVFSQELNLISAGDGLWRWSAGAFYRQAEDSFFQLYSIFSLPPPPVTTTLSVNNDYRDTSESYAVYGEISRGLTDKLELTVGLRYFRDEGELTLDKGYNGPDVVAPAGPDFVLPAGRKYDSTSDAVTPRVVLNWSPADDQTFYASYSQGFRSGFAQQPTVQALYPGFQPVDPDRLTNYELGAKGVALDQRFSYTAAIFYIDWQDVQQSLRVTDPATGLLATAVVNGEGASGIGAELALTVRPINDLVLGASVSWNDLTFDKDIVSGTSTLFRAGDRMALSPEYTVGASVQYTLAMGGGFEGVIGLNGDYTSEQNGGPVIGSQGTIGSNAISLASGKVSIEAPQGWSATLFVDNLTDERRSASPSVSVPEWSSRIRPRTYGIQLDYDF